MKVSGLTALLLCIVALACIGSGCAARTTSTTVQTLIKERLAVIYPYGERFVLDDPQPAAGNDSAPPPPGLNSIDSWEGWLALSIVAIVFFCFGALFCFMGYKLFKFIIAVIGFIAGFLIGIFAVLTVGSWIVGADPSSSDQEIIEWVALGVGILFGILVALVSWWFYIVGIFIVGMCCS
jgi:hypothetical protein